MLTHQAALPFFLSRIATYRDPDGFYCFSIKDAVSPCGGEEGGWPSD
jgi:hypothetical protein